MSELPPGPPPFYIRWIGRLLLWAEGYAARNGLEWQTPQEFVRAMGGTPEEERELNTAVAVARREAREARKDTPE